MRDCFRLVSDHRAGHIAYTAGEYNNAAYNQKTYTTTAAPRTGLLALGALVFRGVKFLDGLIT